MPDLDAFLADLSSAQPVPGGGSVAALEAALGAALLVMVANLTVGRKKYAEVEDEVVRVRSMAQSLQDEARSLVDADAEAYRGVSKAMSLPRDTDQEKEKRREAMQSALREAVGPPLRTMRVASQILDLARQLVEVGNANAVSDVGCAALSARSAYHSAYLNVEINRTAIKDEQFVALVKARLDGLPSPDQVEQQVSQRVLRVIRGE